MMREGAGGWCTWFILCVCRLVAQPPNMPNHLDYRFTLVDLRHDHVDSRRDKDNNLVISRRGIALKSMLFTKTDDAVETP